MNKSQEEHAFSIFSRNKKLQIDGKLESISGYGSSVLETVNTINIIQNVINDFSIKSIADCPCGDWNWFKQVSLNDTVYTGYDIIDELIKENNKEYSSKNISFFVKDALKIILPSSDLILCRDFAFHLNDNQIFTLLDNFKLSKSKYLLITSFNDEIKNSATLNKDGWYFRKINLLESPFNLKFIKHYKEHFNGKYLNLYEY
jgi:hypothetical protein